MKKPIKTLKRLLTERQKTARAAYSAARAANDAAALEESVHTAFVAAEAVYDAETAAKRDAARAAYAADQAAAAKRTEAYAAYDEAR